MSRLTIGSYEIYGKLVQSSLGPRVYDVFARRQGKGYGRAPLHMARLIGQVYRDLGDVHAVAHWRNTRTDTGYRTKWAAMVYLYEAWVDAGLARETEIVS